MRKIQKYFTEKAVFTAFLFLGLLPLFGGKFFITLDGPAHMYNALMIKELLTSPNSFAANFLQFTGHPVPNWSGHFILAALTSIVPFYWAEKILVAAYLILFPVGFRILIQKTAPQNTFLSFFAFPFSWSFTLFLGFYNFLIAWIPFIFCFTLLITAFENPDDRKKWWLIGLLALLTYFSHLFVFAVLGLSAVILFFIQNRTLHLHYLLKSAVALFTAFILPATLAFYHIVTGPESGDVVYKSAGELSKTLINLEPLVALNYPIESGWYQLLSATLILLTVAGIIFTLKTKSTAKNQSKPISVSLRFFAIAMVTLFAIAIYTLPDSNENAGFFSVRLMLFFYLFGIQAMSGFHYPKRIKYAVIPIILTVQIATGVYYTKAGLINNRAAQECFEAGKLIEQNKTVLELNYSPHWLYLHFSHYAGFENSPVFLTNYEASLSYFPLTFNRNTMPNNLFANQTRDENTCLFWESNTANNSRDIDYIIVLGNPEDEKSTCARETLKKLETHYNKVYEKTHCTLYRLK